MRQSRSTRMHEVYSMASEAIHVFFQYSRLKGAENRTDIQDGDKPAASRLAFLLPVLWQNGIFVYNHSDKILQLSPGRERNWIRQTERKSYGKEQRNWGWTPLRFSRSGLSRFGKREFRYVNFWIRTQPVTGRGGDLPRTPGLSCRMRGRLLQLLVPIPCTNILFHRAKDITAHIMPPIRKQGKP